MDEAFKGAVRPETTAADQLAAVRKAIKDYHFALDSRQHGGAAQDKAIHEIEAALDLHWVQGKELKARSNPSNTPA